MSLETHKSLVLDAARLNNRLHPCHSWHMIGMGGPERIVPLVVLRAGMVLLSTIQ